MKLSKKITAAVLSAALIFGIVPAMPAELSRGFDVTASAEKKKLPAPEGLKGTEGATDITLQWKKVSGADGYRVYIFSEEDGKFIKYADVKETTCKVKGLLVETRYRFRVAALVKNKAQTTSATLGLRTQKNKEIKEFTVPEFGSSPIKALTDSGLAKYHDRTNVRAGTVEYVGQTIYRDRHVDAYLYFGAAESLYGYSFYFYGMPIDSYRKIFNEYAEGGFRITKGEKDGSSKETCFTNGKIDVRIVYEGGEMILAVQEKHLPITRDVYVSADEESIKLSWVKVKGADGYRVLIRSGNSDSFKKYADVTGASCRVTDINKGVVYQFGIAALVKDGDRYIVQDCETNVFGKLA